MAKGKKKESEGKKAKLEEKKKKQAKKGEKKQASKAKADESDAEDVDLDAVLAEYAKKQEQFLKVTETPCEPPRARASATIIPNPQNTNELFLFGGEYFNGALAHFFNDLYVYRISSDSWTLIQSQNTPPNRSGHAWTINANDKTIYLFGGEFSSPKQGTFYHYNDFYRLEPSSREWTRIESPKGKSPPARSGHRMTYYKQYIVLFGGFQDTSQATKYLTDLWLYDTVNYVWHCPILPAASQKPDARSSFTLLPHEGGAVMYGGYSRVKSTIVGKQVKGGGAAQRNVLKPMVHTDSWFLRITPPSAESPPNTPPTVRWERRKKPANAPNPPRAGATMAHHQGRGIQFGGVHDVEESEEGIDSEFFNTLFAWNIERNRYFPLALRKPRVQGKKKGAERGGRSGRGAARDDELMRNLAAMEAGKSFAEADDDEDFSAPAQKAEEEAETDKKPEKEKVMELPHPRFNAQLAVQDDVLFIYGGTFEKGDREFTFDEMYAIDLGKLDGVKEIFRREPDNWEGSDSEDDGEDEDDEEDSEDEEEEEIEESVEKKFTESKRKKKVEVADTEVAADMATIGEDEVEDSESKDDNLPHPRPFESRRDFFVRTGNEWQEVFMTSLRWQGIQPETLAVKEIKEGAFKMSEGKWWECREEIVALEDEQEAAGIGEVVSMADRADAGTGGAGRRR